ncbi:hypothetical protein FQN57_001552 [Myotisia sp. PD_48]|nr:hypothetical protein FQN57_001552 [Myotisia sp. PD_48]
MGEYLLSSGFEYSTVPGYFLQDETSTDYHTFDFSKSNFGLINREYDTDQAFDPEHEKSQWQRLERKIQSLNEKAAPNTQFKLLFLGRHGQGYHNVAESIYGTPAWDTYWSKLDGDGTLYWVDAQLTEEGKNQARLARDTWAAQMKDSIPLPETYYTSPLDRCLSTATITFGDLDLPPSQPFIPTVKELLRETIGLHTCDHRSSKGCIQSAYPSVKFEPGFNTEDPLWTADERESKPARDIRLRALLDDIFTHDKNTFISFSSHSGAINSVLNVVGHQRFKLKTGGVIPVLVKAESKEHLRSSGLSVTN